jgi:hypothetical protein
MDTYKVVYDKQKPDGYWVREEQILEANGKAKHEAIKKQFEVLHKHEKINIIGVYFQ